MHLTPQLLDLFTRHINAEQYAAHTYRALACWADSQGFTGLRNWADRAADEEQEHATAFIGYVRQRDAVQLLPISAPPTFADYAGALGAAYALEEAVAASLQAIATEAAMARDDASVELVSGYLLNEQIPACKAIATYMQRVARGAPIDLLDLELFEEG